MEYQKIILLLDNTRNQLSKFKTKNWVEINDESWGTYNKDNQIKFKTPTLRSRLCDYRDAYILVNETITVWNNSAKDAGNNTASKKAIFKKCAILTNCMSRINNTQVDDAHDSDLLMPMYNSIVVTLSTQYYTKLLENIKSGFKSTINWNKYQSKISIERETRYLDSLIDPSF